MKKLEDNYDNKMKQYKNLKNQHDKMLKLLNNIKEKEINNDNIYNVRKEISKFASLFKMHITKEDDLLYSYLLDVGNGDNDKIIKELNSQIEEIAQKFSVFNRKFSREDKILDNQKEFKNNLQNFITILKQQLKKENNKLYAKLP